jgi:hypothetical protein
LIGWLVDWSGGGAGFGWHDTPIIFFACCMWFDAGHCYLMGTCS